MYCKNCGVQLEDNMAFCPECGTPVDAGQSRQSGSDPYDYETRRAAEPMDYRVQEPQRSSEADGYAIASLILGIIGFFLLPVIGGILAIVFGNKSIRENGMNTMARIGKILGIVSLVVTIIALVFVIAAAVLLGVGTVMNM